MISETKVARGTSKDSLLIRRLQAAQAATDTSLRCLEGVYVKNGATFACDGFQWIATPTPEPLTPFEGQIVEGKIPAGEFMTELSTIPGVYPNIAGTIPDVGSEVGSIVVNAKFLKKLANMVGDAPVKLTIYKGKLMIQTQDNHSPAVASLIMAIYPDSVNRPYDPFKQEA